MHLDVSGRVQYKAAGGAMTTVVRIAALLGLLSVTVRAAPIDPRALALSAARGVYVGNSSRVSTLDGAPAPIGGGGWVLLDERCLVGDVSTVGALHTRLQSTVAGNVLVAGGAVDLGNQTTVRGDLVARDGVVVGVSSVVAGDVTVTRGALRVARLAAVLGGVYADGEFRGERDIRVGSPGTLIAVRGPASIRDRGEYFGRLVSEESIAFFGVGDPILHAGAAVVERGTLDRPAPPAWQLGRAVVPAVAPGTQDVLARPGPARTVEPGAYRRLELEQDATARLGPGRYVFGEIVAHADARLVIEAEPGGVELAIARDVKLGDRFRLRLTSGDPSRLVVRVGGSFRIDHDGVWAGTVLAGEAAVFGKHTVFAGAAWSGGEVHLGRDSIVVWTPSAAPW